MSKFRAKVHNKGGDKRYFSKTASMMHKKNIRPAVMRGGFKL